VSEVKALIEAESDKSKRADLEVELDARQHALQDLMDGFAVRFQITLPAILGGLMVGGARSLQMFAVCGEGLHLVSP